jgi:hypothetical protein
VAIFAQIISGTVANVAIASASANLPTGVWVRVDTLTPQPAIGWAYNGSVFTAPSAPTQPPSQRAAALLASKVAVGLVLTSTSTPTLNATYALDDVSTDQIFQIGLYAAQFAMFPSGAATQSYPDVSGIPHVFTVTQFVAFLHAVAALISGLTTQAGVMAGGGNPVWPSQSVVIA